MGKQSVALEHRIDLPLIGGHIVDPAFIEDDVSRRRRQKPSDDAQRRRLAAAGGPQEGQKFVVVNVEINIV